jgi:hypothetical protein
MCVACLCAAGAGVGAGVGGGCAPLAYHGGQVAYIPMSVYAGAQVKRAAARIGLAVSLSRGVWRLVCGGCLCWNGGWEVFLCLRSCGNGLE